MTSSEQTSDPGAGRPLGVIVRRGDSDHLELCPPPSSRIPSAHANTIIGLGEDFIDELRRTRPWIKPALPSEAAPEEFSDEDACSPLPPLTNAAGSCSVIPPASVPVTTPTPSVTPPPLTATVKCEKPKPAAPAPAPTSASPPPTRQPTAITLVSSEVVDLGLAPPGFGADFADGGTFGAQLRLHVRNIAREVGQLTIDAMDAVERWLRGTPTPSP